MIDYPIPRLRLILSYLCVVPLLLATACGESDGKSTEEDSTEVVPSDDQTAGYSLSTCTTTIADDVPDFFKTYFRCVKIELNGDSVVIRSQGLPPYPSFYYAEDHVNHTPYTAATTESYQNPGVIGEQSLEFEIPLNPTPKGLTISASLVDGIVNSSSEEYSMGPVGVALNSVAIFNPLAGPGDDILDELHSFDAYSGHPAGSTYHYHTSSPGPLEVLSAAGLVTTSVVGEAEIEVYGILCDGTLVLGCTELNGDVPDSSGLDAQNGHVHDLADGGGTVHFTDRYHTHICGDNPFTGHLFTPEVQYYEGCN